MTIRRLINTLLCASLTLFSGHTQAAQRAETFTEALQQAGSDGVIAYCYGPDWNRRSVALLRSFWQTESTEAAAGNAVLVAVPFYESHFSPGAEQAAHIRGSMPEPPFSVCPTVMFFDQSGRHYATLQGSDYLGADAACTEGIKRIEETIKALREQQKLLADAAAATKEEQRAAILGKVADLPIAAPPDLLQRIKEADPKDKSGYARRLEFNARQFMYKLLDTEDGFLHPDFEPDFNRIMKECEAVLRDEALRTRDRQQAYNLYIGQARREHIQSNKLKALIRKVHKLDKETDYGQLSPTLMQLWGNLKVKPSGNERRESRAEKRRRDKEKRDKKRKEKHLEIN